jgi:hypothetical protein
MDEIHNFSHNYDYTPSSDSYEFGKMVDIRTSAYKSELLGIMKTCRWKKSL